MRFFAGAPFFRLTKFWVSIFEFQNTHDRTRLTKKSSDNVKMLNGNVSVATRPNIQLCSTPKYRTLTNSTHLR